MVTKDQEHRVEAIDRSKKKTSSSLTAMIVDEHDFIRKVSSKILKKIGFKKIIECSNGKDAKNVILKSQIDLIICNTEVPYFSGYELLLILRSLDTKSDIPFLFLTGTTHKDEVVKAAEFGANEYIVLPVQAEDLEAKISNALQVYFHPSHHLKKLRLAEAFLISKDFSKALELATEVLDSKESARASHLIANIHLQSGNSDEAIRIFTSNIEKYPDFLKNYSSLANYYLEKGDSTGAIETLSEELVRNPKQPLRQITLGNLLLKEHRLEEAVSHFKLALIESPKNPDALYGMGHSLAKQGRIEKAIYYFKRYRKHHPADSKPLKAILKITAATEHRRLGELAIKDEIKAHPERPDASYILSEHYVKLKEYDLAQDVLADLCKRHAEYLEAYSLLSKIYILRKEPDRAIQLFQELCQRSENPDCLIGLAGVYLLLGKFSHCITTLNTAISNQANPEKVFRSMLEATYKTRQFGKAFFLREICSHINKNSNIRGLDSFDAIESWIKQRSKARKAVLAS